MENDFSRVVDAIPGLARTALPDGYIDFLSQRGRKYAGLSVDEACGFGWQTAIHPEGMPQLLECWRLILASTEPGDTGARQRLRETHDELVSIKPSLVSVVDDDESVRESLPDLLREFGFAVRGFSSAEDFLASDCVGQTKCLILDIAMPGMSGPDLQRELTRRRQKIPIVFITAHGDETVRPRVLKQGAVECLFKPFSDTALLEALNAALRAN
jgi:CheY-like chemotaxis protein